MPSFCFRKDYDNNREATGYVAASGGRGPGVIFSALFTVVAFNAVAVSLADCDGRLLNGSLAFTSVVSTLATIEGVITPIVMPILGGIADTTPHRKLLLGLSYTIVIATIVLQGIFYLPVETTRPDPNDPSVFLTRPIIYSDATFLILAGILLINVISYELVALLTVSYAPELTKDQVKQMGFIADSYAANNGSQLFFLVLALGITLPLGLDSLGQGAAAAFICALYMSTVFTWGYLRLGNRRDIDPELNKKYCGLAQLFSSILEMIKTYKEILKFLISYSFIFAGVSSSVSLATTYFQLYLGYSGGSVSILLGLALVCSVPGSILARIWVKKFGIGVKKLYIIVTILYAIAYLLAPILLVSERAVATGNSTLSQFGKCDSPEPGDVIGFQAPGYVFYLSILFVIVNGLCLGHVYPLNTQFYALLIPGGQENSYYGMKVLASKILVWLPPLGFTLISEATGGDLRLALVPIGVMFLIGAFIVAFVDLEKGEQDIKETLKFRQGLNRRASVDPTFMDKIGVVVDDPLEEKRRNPTVDI